MSIIQDGVISDSNLSKNAMGGTEMMRGRLLKYVHPTLLENVAIHFSRSPGPIDGYINIFYAHDLPQDPANNVLRNDGWMAYDHFVFVSYWQREQYHLILGIPYDISTVIQNAIETPIAYTPKEDDGIRRFIYHTTPHRGLELLIPVFEQLTKEYPKSLHLDVYSSFKIYGWEERDKPYEKLFDLIQKDESMTYHGAQPNAEILKALHRSDFFLYPCIWRETSCLAMIEAMAHSCLVIHPDLAVLPETGALGPTIMYDWHPNTNEHMNRAYTAAKHALEADSFQINRYVAESFTPKSGMLNVNHFAQRWSILLTVLREQLLEEVPEE